MAILPVNGSATAKAIYAEYERQKGASWRRPHLGASQIGNPCERALWYGYRWCSEPRHPGRVLRLFESGSLEEPRVINNLRAIGCTVYDSDPDTGKQFNYSEYGGHFAGSLDGVVLGIPEAPKTNHLLEIKTHNLKSFTKLKLEGVQRAKPMHLAQMICYMGWAELTRALYFAVCKDNDEIHTERIHEDPSAFAEILERARRIITSTEAPARQSLDCEWCDHRAVCFDGELPQIHCRTCRRAVPIIEGRGAKWRCRRDDSERNQMMQERGCDSHLYIPSLVGFAVAVEEQDDHVVYQKAQTYFANSIPSSFPAISGECYASKDMRKAR